ncbi:hypothetical protein T4D_10721 [Trichinella pseudospiralis]|uniref:Uncharacterized protein n=1 Tax=Trichinella pseudospiralis TaxID=6337 RepID=A0A0V1FZV2_TRIPS|nr:hypothetical protein T4D_10721 [Trichinella pseudospiralis]
MQNKNHQPQQDPFAVLIERVRYNASPKNLHIHFYFQPFNRTAVLALADNTVILKICHVYDSFFVANLEITQLDFIKIRLDSYPINVCLLYGVIYNSKPNFDLKVFNLLFLSLFTLDRNLGFRNLR